LSSWLIAYLLLPVDLVETKKNHILIITKCKGLQGLKKSHHENLLVVQGDVKKDHANQEVVESAIKKFGSIDGQS
jgi:NADP-dependent 3-hydroxy acid dehydrogenase YdfG